MAFRLRSYGGPTAPVGVLRMRCPECLHMGTLAVFADQDYQVVPVGSTVMVRVGWRACPNPECQQILYVMHDGAQVLSSFPAERVDFDATNLPPGVLTTLEEAVACHAAGCYVAAAMMVRRTLEELCEDRGATGDTLKDRISALAATVVIPHELLDGLDDLRLLGNDAAHVHARTYQQIGKDEVEVSLEFTKEVLKAVYQYTALLSRLRSLKKQSP
jgi:Domain of unknown function (DUF4145)